MTDRDLAKLFARRFIQRPGVKAIQFTKRAGAFSAGDYFPDTRIDSKKHPNNPNLPVGFNMDHLLAHLAGERTYGHYLLDDSNQCKFFLFDIDLEKSGTYVVTPDWSEYKGSLTDPNQQELWFKENSVIEAGDLRKLWTDRTRAAAPARSWLKWQMKVLAHRLAGPIREMGIDCAVTYSGSKGVHVYGLLGTSPASEAREAAMLALDMASSFGAFKPARGNNFFKHENDDPVSGFQNFSIEVFPKQESLEGKSLGNLVRLPMGTNWKNPKDPTFFLDMTTPLAEFKPVKDPVKLLEEGDPFA